MWKEEEEQKNIVERGERVEVLQRNIELMKKKMWEEGGRKRG